MVPTREVRTFAYAAAQVYLPQRPWTATGQTRWTARRAARGTRKLDGPFVGRFRLQV